VNKPFFQSRSAQKKGLCVKTNANSRAVWAPKDTRCVPYMKPRVLKALSTCALDGNKISCCLKKNTHGWCAQKKTSTRWKKIPLWCAQKNQSTLVAVQCMSCKARSLKGPGKPWLAPAVHHRQGWSDGHLGVSCVVRSSFTTVFYDEKDEKSDPPDHKMLRD
jgi:hypothetical protein